MAAEEEECTLCFEPLAGRGPTRKLQDCDCPQTYHRRCIEEWLQKKPKCPVCSVYIEVPGAAAGKAAEAPRSAEVEQINARVEKIRANMDITGDEDADSVRLANTKTAAELAAMAAEIKNVQEEMRQLRDQRPAITGKAPNIFDRFKGHAVSALHFRPNWNCPDCVRSNSPERSECKSCRCYRSKSVEYRNRAGGFHSQSKWPGGPAAGAGAGAGTGAGAGGFGEWEKGDWRCRGCGKMNFARRKECFKCGDTDRQEYVADLKVPGFAPLRGFKL